MSYNRKMAGKKKRRLTTKGAWLNMPMFNVTLEERATCPSTCPQWEDCYGNNMPFAHRYQVGAGLEKCLDADVSILSTRYPDGFIVRLHVLGDFPSVAYVRAWLDRVERHPALRVFGFTHWQPGTPIGEAITAGLGDRFRIMRSDPTVEGDSLPAAYTLPVGREDPVEGTVLCPWYAGKTESCLTCGLCWNGRISVSFPRH